MDGAKQLRRMYNGVIAAIVVAVIIIIVVGGVYTVEEQERAVITTFGKAGSVVGAGMHFKIPIVQQAHKVPMTIEGMPFGYYVANGIDQLNESESFMITKDFNFVNVDFFVEWRVSDPVKYLYASEDPQLLLRNILQSEARSVVSSYEVDDVLTTAKGEIQVTIRDNVSVKLEEYDIGINVVNVTLQDATPPTNEVIAAFKNVENAKQYRETQINEAYAFENTVIPAARADADKVVQEAEAHRISRINAATGQTARFNEMFDEYMLNKDITQTRMYLETMESVLPGISVYVDGTGDMLKFLNLNPEGNAPQTGYSPYQDNTNRNISGTEGE